MQSACMGALLELSEADEKVMYLTADSGEGGLDKMYRMHFPERALEFGIAEGNMVGAAAGLATAGRKPFVYTAAPFLAYRSYEFIRDDLCLQNLKVTLIGTGSGLSVPSLGPTHHTTEDIAALRALPNLLLLSPATPKEAAACVKAAYRYEGPSYIRLAMNKEKEFFEGLDTDAEPIPREVRSGEADSPVLLSTGAILEEAVRAADILEEKIGKAVKVISIPVLKPFPDQVIAEMIADAPTVITVEEHNRIGGLGSIVAETVCDFLPGRKLIRIGLEDAFSVGYGKLNALRDENGLSGERIAERVYERIHI